MSSEPVQRFANPSERVSLPVDNAVEELLLWRDPVKSGLAFAGATALYILLQWTNVSLISLLATSSALLIATCFVWASLAHALNRPGPPIPQILRDGVSEHQLKSLVDSYTPLINKGLALVYRLVSGREIFLSGQVLLALIVIAKLGRAFSVLSWAFIVVFVAFTLPKVYELRKREIDAAAANVTQQTQKLYNQHVAPQVAKIPRASSATHARTRPSGDVKKTY